MCYFTVQLTMWQNNKYYNTLIINMANRFVIVISVTMKIIVKRLANQNQKRIIWFVVSVEFPPKKSINVFRINRVLKNNYY